MSSGKIFLGGVSAHAFGQKKGAGMTPAPFNNTRKGGPLRPFSQWYRASGRWAGTGAYVKSLLWTLPIFCIFSSCAAAGRFPKDFVKTGKGPSSDMGNYPINISWFLPII